MEGVPVAFEALIKRDHGSAGAKVLRATEVLIM